MAKDNVFLRGIKEKYPEELLEKRMEIEGNVVSCLWKDPLLLDEYGFTKKDFITKDAKFYFELAKDLHSKGLMMLDEVSVLSNSSEQVIEAFDARGGFDTIEQMTSVVNMNNWDSYSDQLYRENLIISLYNHGFNLLKEIDYNGKKMIPINAFRKWTAEQVVDFYETQLAGFEIGQSSSVLQEGEIDFDESWLVDLKEGVNNGVPFDRSFDDVNGEPINCFPFLSGNISGLLKGTSTAIGGFSSTGKSTLWITILMALLYRGEKILIISNEETIEKFKIKFLVWTLAKYNRYYRATKKRLMAGDIDTESRKQIKIAQQFWKDNDLKENLKFIAINDANISVVTKKIREYVLKHGCTTVLYDTFKINNADMREARQDLALVRDSRELDKLAKKYDIIMLYSIQLAEALKGKLWLDSSCLSNSKQIKEQLENLCLLRNVYDEELDEKSKVYLRPFRRVKKGDIWIEEEFICDRSRTWKILFLEKTRNGSNTSDSNVAYLLSFDGDHALFRETCLCRPKHGQIV